MRRMILGKMLNWTGNKQCGEWVLLKGKIQNQELCGSQIKGGRIRLARYADYIIFNNVIILCEGEDSKGAFKLCNDLIDLLGK